MVTVAMLQYYRVLESMRRPMVALLSPAEGWGALRALLGTSGPMLSSNIQKYTYNICILSKTLKYCSIAAVIIAALT